jgi:probable F420-dependent oxidoreductase
VLITRATHAGPRPATPGLGIQLRFVEEVPVATAAEQAGFTRVTVGDNMTDGFAMCGTFAAVTEAAELHTSIVSWTRTPATTALASSTVAKLTGGRFVLGLGAMPKHWSEDHHGVDYARPVDRMRDYIGAVRACWAATPQQPVDYEGEFYRLVRYAPMDQPSPHKIPITLGVIRPRMSYLAGEVADGVCIDSMHSLGYAQDVLLPQIEAGRVAAGRTGDPFDVSVAVICAVGDTLQEARDLARRTISWYLLTPYLRDVLAHHGFAEEYDKGSRALAEGGVDAAQHHIHDEIVETIAVVGTRDTFREKLSRYDGVMDWVRLSPPHGNPVSVVREQALRLVEAATL